MTEQATPKTPGTPAAAPVLQIQDLHVDFRL
ncbi:nickel import ATP-binding protein NikD, partial [Streptomyces sp. SID11233]|nr:nickel import ATP-binding protein NikD [Streptomyces sp. SID11233]